MGLAILKKFDMGINNFRDSGKNNAITRDNETDEGMDLE